MKTKTILCLALCLFCSLASTNAQNIRDKRTKIKDYLNQEILIIDRFAWQSITLVKEKKDYYIIRSFFGSGVPVIGSIKYKVVFNSNYQISFSEIIDTSNRNLVKHHEVFDLGVEDNGIVLYLNGLKVEIDEHFFKLKTN